MVLDNVEVQVVKACLKYARSGMQRALAKAQSENVGAALRKDLAAIDAVVLKLENVKTL